MFGADPQDGLKLLGRQDFSATRACPLVGNQVARLLNSRCLHQFELVSSTGIEPVSETSYHYDFRHRVIVCGLDYAFALGW